MKYQFEQTVQKHDIEHPRFNDDLIKREIAARLMEKLPLNVIEKLFNISENNDQRDGSKVYRAYFNVE